MSKTSVQQLSQRLAERQRSDQELAEQATSKALAELDEILRSESQRARDGIRDGSESLVQQLTHWARQVSEAQLVTARLMAEGQQEASRVTAEQISVHEERLRSTTAAAQERLRALLARSLLPLALVWGLASCGALAAAGSSWWAWKQGQQLLALQSSLERVQGVKIETRGNRTFLVAPRLGAPFQTQGNRAAVEILNP